MENRKHLPVCALIIGFFISFNYKFVSLFLFQNPFSSFEMVEMFIIIVNVIQSIGLLIPLIILFPKTKKNIWFSSVGMFVIMALKLVLMNLDVFSNRRFTEWQIYIISYVNHIISAGFIILLVWQMARNKFYASGNIWNSLISIISMLVSLAAYFTVYSLIAQILAYFGLSPNEPDAPVFVERLEYGLLLVLDTHTTIIMIMIVNAFLAYTLSFRKTLKISLLTITPFAILIILGFAISEFVLRHGF